MIRSGTRSRRSAFQKLCEDKLDKRIAVLPFENLSDPRDEYFSDGLSEELISALAQISELKVIGRSSSFRFKDRKEEPKTIGEKLGVSTLLEGTVRKQGNRVRIVAALTNAADGIELWTRTFDRELKDIFAVQEEIAKAVAESLKVRLLGSDERSAQKAAPISVEAHNAYLQGHFYFQRRSLDDYRKAVSYFDEAIRLDPNYALAYAERSEAWTFIGDLSPEQKEAWGSGEKGCGEGRRSRSESRRGARGTGLGSLFHRLEVRRRAERAKARQRNLARKSDRERPPSPSDDLPGAAR